MRVRGLRPALAAAAGAAALALLVLLGEKKFGLLGLVVPFALIAAVTALRFPFFTLCVTLGLTVICEGPTVDVPIMAELYKNLYGGIEPVDLFVTLTFFAVVADLMRRGREPRLPAVPAFALMLVAFAAISGIAVGHDAGISLKQAVLSINPIVELVVMTFAVYNLDLDDRRLVKLIRGAIVLAAFKAIFGLFIMTAGLSADVNTGTTITYYEPTANWIGLVTMFGLLAAGLGDGQALRQAVAERFSGAREALQRQAGRRRGPYAQPLVLKPSRRDRRRWQAPAAPAPGGDPVWQAPVRTSTRIARRLRSRWGIVVFGLVVACLILSYRRSFWIGGALGLLILIPLASTPRKRLMILPVALLLGGAIYTLQAIDYQAVAPIVKRATSLQPSQLANNAEDRYRLDERANVIAEIKEAPLTGLGVEVPWVATVRSLGIEHVEGRLYVDFGLLWWWLKCGILGAAAYLGLLISMATMGFKAWRRHVIPEFRYFGLASLCAVFSIAAIETTAAFTGVDARFSVLFGAQFGLLAVLSDRRSEPSVPDAAEADPAERALGPLQRPAPGGVRRAAVRR